MRLPIANDERMAITHRTRHPPGAEVPPGTPDVLEDYRLPKRCSHLLAEHACDHVGRAPRRKGDHDGDRFRGKGLCSKTSVDCADDRQ
jgi:hypothetical protein